LSKQAKRNAMAIENNLDSVFAEDRTTVPFVNALLVFANSNSRLNIKEPTIPVLRSSDLAPFIAGYNAGQTPSPASLEWIRAIVQHLHLLQQRLRQNWSRTVSSLYITPPKASHSANATGPKTHFDVSEIPETWNYPVAGN
jgi:hypothetical protein